MDKRKLNNKKRAKKRAQMIKKIQKEQKKKYKRDHPKKIDWQQWKQIGKKACAVAVTCFLAYICVWYFGQQISTVGDSMTPILSNGDIVLVNRLVYDAMSPDRGDVIVFKPKGNQNSHYYIKRIIGLPGETIEMIEGSVYIDGEKLIEPYETTEIKNVGIVNEKIQLSENEYFVLGDNRENSEDSRMSDVGMVKRSYILGKAWFVLQPWKHIRWIR